MTAHDARPGAAVADWRTNRTRLWTGLLIALAVCAVSYFRGFDALERQRIKLVEQAVSSDDGTVALTPVNLSALVRTGEPVAVILRTRSGEPGPRAFVLAIDGVPACRFSTSSPEPTRTDCSGTLPTGEPHTLTVSAAPGWTLDYLEVATHHGNSSGALYFVILPAASRLGTTPSGLLLAVCALTTFAGWVLLPAAPLPRGLRWAHRGLAALAAAIAAALLLAPFVSPFRVVVSVWTVVFVMLLVGMPRLWTVGQWLHAAPAPGHARRGWVTRATVVALFVGFIYWQPVRHRLVEYHGNYSGFLMISAKAFDTNPLTAGNAPLRSSLILLNNGGYDGQFMYFVAFDPLMRAFQDEPRKYRDVVDAVPYRFGRVGFPVLTSGVTNRPAAYPRVMIWTLLAALAAAAFFLALIAQVHGRSAVLGALVLLVPGFWQSIQTALPEPLAAAALLAGLLCAWTGRPALAGVLFAGSLLVRETGIIVVALVGAGAWLRGQRRHAFLMFLLAAVPLALWRLYVGLVIYPDWGVRGFFDHPADLTLPLGGFVDLWQAVAQRHYAGNVPGMARAGVSYSVLVCLAAALGLAAARRATAVAWSAASYALLAVSLNYEMIWVHVGNGQRGTYELFVLLALLAATDPVRPPAVWMHRLVWAGAAAYIVFGGFDAEFVQTALAWPT